MWYTLKQSRWLLHKYTLHVSHMMHRFALFEGIIAVLDTRVHLLVSVVLHCTDDTGVVLNFTPQWPEVCAVKTGVCCGHFASWPASLMFYHEVIADQLMGQVHLERKEVALGLTLHFVVCHLPLQDIGVVDGCLHEWSRCRGTTSWSSLIYSVWCSGPACQRHSCCLRRQPLWKGRKTL